MHQAHQRGNPFGAQDITRADQHPRDQERQILIELLPHAPELRFVQSARRLQAAR